MDIILALADSKNSKKVWTKLGFAYQETFDYEGDPTDWFGLKKTVWQSKNSTH